MGNTKFRFIVQSIACIFFSCLSLLSCERASAMEKYISPDKNITDLCHEVLDEKMINLIIGSDLSFAELNAQYRVECVRKEDENYRVVFRGNDRVGVLFYDSSGKKISGKIYCAEIERKMLDELKPGDSLEKVQTIDPNGEYLFLFTGRNDFPRISSHYTKDGFLFSIEYGNDCSIKRIERKLI